MRNLIDELLEQQSTLQTPIAKFSEKHHTEPDLAPHYRTLIPLSKPGKNEQYAFEVSLDRCTSCKACVSACSSLNGLDQGETWRDIGTLLGGTEAPTYQQTITTACHHCEDPACMNGCPVGAYEKDQSTGIVRHLDDQCIGCSYCILKCPYDVPKYSKTRGIVRKCDMCHQRLAEGEAPACVQACPTEAISIVKHTKTEKHTPHTRNHPDSISLFKSRILSATSTIPDAKITLPTTRYIGRPTPLTAYAADRETLHPQHAHWPLVFMLVLTQTGLGLTTSGLYTASHSQLPLLITGAIIFNLGMIAATLHLGQPLKAWRFFLGLKTSWLSREILAFSLIAPIPIILITLKLLPDLPFKNLATTLIYLSAIPAFLTAIFTSVMIYQDTQRQSWRLAHTLPRFFGTYLSFATLGLAITHPTPVNLILFTLIALGKTIPELILISSKNNKDWSADRHAARIHLGPLRTTTILRFSLLPLALIALITHPWAALPILLISEVLERQLFFQSCHAPKMPGHFS